MHKIRRTIMHTEYTTWIIYVYFAFSCMKMWPYAIIMLTRLLFTLVVKCAIHQLCYYYYMFVALCDCFLQTLPKRRSNAVTWELLSYLCGVAVLWWCFCSTLLTVLQCGCDNSCVESVLILWTILTKITSGNECGYRKL